MRFRRPLDEEPEVNLIPLIDVLLIVLIFMAVSTTYSRYAELKIELPTADATQPLVRPNEKPQERVFTAPAYLGRYGPGFLDDVLSAATAFYTGALEAAMTRS